jgi:hypothetical protein
MQTTNASICEIQQMATLVVFTSILSTESATKGWMSIAEAFFVLIIIFHNKKMYLLLVLRLFLPQLLLIPAKSLT